MKNLILITVFTIFAFGSINAQEAPAPVEVTSIEKVACKPGCEKACCTAKGNLAEVEGAVEKAACKPGCEKACCKAEDSSEKVSSTEKGVKKCCAKGEKKACKASTKVAEAKTCKPGCEKACCVS